MGPTFNKLEVKDPGHIKKLITESAESIEPGLKIIDSGGLVGHATIDLVGLDSKESLVLIALGLTADDGMLLRVLEAGSWCFEYPDTIRRLYPTARVQSGRAPRALFIAERLPDSFLRKIRHLGFPEIDCLEFRYLQVAGTSVVHFHPVEQVRRAGASEPLVEGSAGLAETPSTEPESAKATPPVEPVIQPTETGARNGTPAEVAAPVVAEAPAVTGTADSTEQLRREWEEFLSSQLGAEPEPIEATADVEQVVQPNGNGARNGTPAEVAAPVVAEAPAHREEWQELLSQFGTEPPVEASAGLAETPSTEPEPIEATAHVQQVVQPNGNGARNGKPAQVAAPLVAEAPAVTPRADNLEAHREEWQELLSQLGTLHLPKNGELSREWREFLTQLLGAAR